MNILEIKVMRGPNFWSNYRRQLIVMKLDLGKYEALPTDKLPGFYNRLTRAIPSLVTHHCSEGKEGGLLIRIKEGTWLGHVIEHVALEIQSLAGMDCGFGRTRSTGQEGVYKVVFSYVSEKAGRYAAQVAVDFVAAIAEKRPYPLKQQIKHLEEIWNSERLGPSTQSIVDEAKKRGIPVHRMDEDSLIMLGHGEKQQLFRATVMGTTSNIAVETVACKWATKSILSANNIPVPQGRAVETKAELLHAIAEIGFPLVIKPIDGNHGSGITANITSREGAFKAFRLAKRISDTVIAEQYVTGDDYRFLVINYKLVAVSKRTPAKVTGDGKSTIKELVAAVNASPQRGADHEKCLTQIKLDAHTKNLLTELGLTIHSVLPPGKELLLKKTANLSTGGTATDVTDFVHPENVFVAERIAQLMHLDVCGIDVMAHDVTFPLTTAQNGYVLEVNAGPGFRMHTHPSEGKPRNVAEPVVDMLFSNGSNGRIPIVAVTGTNGKTTTTRLIAHLARQQGLAVGYTTTEGIYINNHLIAEGDCTGSISAKTVLHDPTVNFAVLECARGGILRSGLGFDHCDISVVTNVTEDHLGLEDIDDMDDYTRVKEVVARSTVDSGYAILNADDDRVYGMHPFLSCQVVLFSRDHKNPRITDHCNEGGRAVFIEHGDYVFCHGNTKTRIIAVNKVPLTFSGSAGFMAANVLPAIAAALLSGFEVEVINAGLTSFHPSPELTPGRMNLFDFGTFQLMLDYAHNEAGFQEIQKYMTSVRATHKTCIIGATGDRRDGDIRKVGYYAASIFDQVIIRHDEDNRGRPNEELTDLLLEGIRIANSNTDVHVISDEKQAIEYAVTHARPEAFVFVCADHVMRSISIIQEFQDKFVHTTKLRAS